MRPLASPSVGSSYQTTLRSLVPSSRGFCGFSQPLSAGPIYWPLVVVSGHNPPKALVFREVSHGREKWWIYESHITAV